MGRPRKLVSTASDDVLEKLRKLEELSQKVTFDKSQTAQSLYIPPDSVPCKLCLQPASKGHIYCYTCLWKTRWATHILNDPENERRRKRSHLTKLISVRYEIPEGTFLGSTKSIYTTHLSDCTCKDFALGHKGRPCKHIYRLASELGLYTSECFEKDEDDYIMHIHKQIFDVDEYFKKFRSEREDANCDA